MKIEIKKSTKLVDYNYAIQFLEKRVKNVIDIFPCTESKLYGFVFSH